MAYKSKISWTNSTWNPITGCTRVSKGCQNCYAERLAHGRLKHHPSRKGLTDANGRWTGEVRFNSQWLDQPLRWRKPRMIFVVAHGDLFHEAIPEYWIDRVFAIMALCPQHTFQVLTKRPMKMREYILDSRGRVADRLSDRSDRYWSIEVLKRVPPHSFRAAWDRVLISESWPPRNVWLGTSVEDQRTADERIPLLLDTPAAVRWISAEPLLSGLSVYQYLCCKGCGYTPKDKGLLQDHHLCRNPSPTLDWGVVGGESGPGYRPMDPNWARHLRDEFQKAGVACFVKQMAGKKEIPADLMVREYPCKS